MTAVSLNAATASPAPRPARADEAAPAGDFAALLDGASADQGVGGKNDARASGEKTSSESGTARPHHGKGHAPKTDTAETAGQGGAADATAEGTPTAEATSVPSTTATADAGDTAKGDKPAPAIGEGAETEVTEKTAGDAALTDPTSVLTGMLLDLTAPPAKDQAVTPPTPKAPDDTATGAAEIKAKAPENGEKARAGASRSLATPFTTKAAETATQPAGTESPAATTDAPAAASAATASTTTASAPVLGHAATPLATLAPAPAPEAMPRATYVPLEPEALSVAIARHIDDGNHVFEISLTPDDLGRVDVRLEVDEQGRMTAQVYAERPETLKLLQQDRAELIRSLAAQSPAAQNATVNFSLRDGSSGQGGQGGGQQQNGEGGQRGRGRGNAAAVADVAGASGRGRYRRGDALAVDIQV